MIMSIIMLSALGGAVSLIYKASNANDNYHFDASNKCTYEDYEIANKLSQNR